MQGTFLIDPAAGLAVGDYTGRIRLMACSDQNCNHQVGNSPLIVNYTTHVRSTLHVSTEAIDFASQSDSGVSGQDVTVTLPWGSTAFTTETRGSGNFLIVTQPTPTTLHIAARALPSGTYNELVEVFAGGFSKIVVVNYTVTPPPGGEFNLRTDTPNITMSAVEHTVGEPVMLHVYGPTWAPNMATRAVPLFSGPEWLTIESVPGGYRLTPSALQLGAGNYHLTMFINPDDFFVPAAQIQIEITLTVGSGLVEPSPRTVLIDANTQPGAAVLSGSTPIELVGGPPSQWKATVNSPWLTLTRSTGATGTDLEWQINLAGLDLAHSYTQRDDEALISITNADGAPYLTPVIYKIKLQQRLAHILGLGPNYLIGDRPGRVVVRGYGFIANRDWSQCVHVNGVPAGAGRVTRVNDTELLLDLDAYPAGDPVNYVYVELINALGATPGWDPLFVFPTRTQVYTAIPTGFPVSKLLYQHNGQTLMLLNDADGAYSLYNKSSGGFGLVGQGQVAGLKDIVVRPDGQRWFITAAGIYYDGMPTGFETPDPNWNPLHIAPFGDSFAFTNDGRIWFAADDGLGHGSSLSYKPFPSGTFISSPWPLQGALDGPWFITSGNGERVYIAPSSSTLSPALVLALDAADSQVYELAAASQAANLREASINMDGSRLVGVDYQVRNLAYQPIGALALPAANYRRMASAVSSDGTRAYVLAYDEADLVPPAPTGHPRVYVFDITTPVDAGQPLPVLGYFTLDHFPGCLQATDCPRRPRMTVAADGLTLYMAGNLNLVVAPIPQDVQLQVASAPPRLNKQAPRTHPWHLNLRPN